MARQERYTIGPNLLRDIRSTIQKVDALAPHTSGPTQGVRYWDMQRPAQRLDVFRICTFTGSWAINSTKTVTFKYQTTTPNTVVATNLFCGMEPSGAQTSCEVSVAKDGTAWFLVQPNLTHLPGYTATGVQSLTIAGGNLQIDGGAIRIGTISSAWAKGTTATVARQTGSGAPIGSETFVAQNYFASVTPAGGGARVACARVDNIWVLIAAEC